jgi:hypothetical protein
MNESPYINEIVDTTKERWTDRETFINGMQKVFDITMEKIKGLDDDIHIMAVLSELSMTLLLTAFSTACEGKLDKDMIMDAIGKMYDELVEE